MISPSADAASSVLLGPAAAPAGGQEKEQPQRSAVLRLQPAGACRHTSRRQSEPSKEGGRQAGRACACASPAGACRLAQAVVSRWCMSGTSLASAGSTQGCRWRSAGGEETRSKGGKRTLCFKQIRHLPIKTPPKPSPSAANLTPCSRPLTCAVPNVWDEDVPHEHAHVLVVQRLWGWGEGDSKGEGGRVGGSRGAAGHSMSGSTAWRVRKLTLRLASLSTSTTQATALLPPPLRHPPPRTST